MFQFLRILVVSSDLGVTALASSVLNANGHHVAIMDVPEIDRAWLANATPFDRVLFDPSPQRSCNLASLQALAHAGGSGSVWMLAPLGMDLWRAEAAKLGIRNFLHKPLEARDLNPVQHHLWPVKTPLPIMSRSCREDVTSWLDARP
jgi:DNA-binding response OmpR family regulator